MSTDTSDTEYVSSGTYKDIEAEDSAWEQWQEYDNKERAEYSALCRSLAYSAQKDVAQTYVAPLLTENILEVTKDNITIMGLTIPRGRLVYFHIALSSIFQQWEIAQNKEHGYTYGPCVIVSGNETQPGYKITSNVEGEGSIILTRKLAQELWEVLVFFIPTS